MPKYKIDLSKKYIFPEEIKIVRHKEIILVIAPEYACWVVLKSEEQLNILNYLRSDHSIKEALNTGWFNHSDINYVVTMIEARRFYQKDVHSSTNNEQMLHLYLTNKCNLSCPHCYMYSGQANTEELTTDEIINLLINFKKETGGQNITISGGEPTVREDFDFIVESAYSIGLKIKVLTNGSLLSKNRIKRLSHFLDSVQISLDGFSEETNSKIRGKGHFKIALEAVEALIECGIKTSIAMTPPLHILRDHTKEFVQFAQMLSTKYEGEPFQIKFAEELIDGRNIRPTIDTKNEYFTLMRSVLNDIYGSDYETLLFARAFDKNNILDNCMFGILTVTSNGNVYFCPRTGDIPPIANIRLDSFKKITKEARIAANATLITKLQPCKSCELRFICGGGCRIDEFHELINRKSFIDIDYSKIPAKLCDLKVKERFYDLMLKSDPYLYLPLDES